MAVLTRFRVIERAEVDRYNKDGIAYRIKLQGVKSGPFGEATPVANAEMLIVPEEAAAEFPTGKYILATWELDLDQEDPSY